MEKASNRYYFSTLLPVDWTGKTQSLTLHLAVGKQLS